MIYFDLSKPNLVEPEILKVFKS